MMLKCANQQQFTLAITYTMQLCIHVLLWMNTSMKYVGSQPISASFGVLQFLQLTALTSHMHNAICLTVGYAIKLLITCGVIRLSAPNCSQND